jgi:hypothetical protein
MKYYNKFTKYTNKLIQIGSSDFSSLNIFDDITMQYPDTIYKIIETLSIIIYFPEKNPEIRLQGLKNTLQYPDAWHMPESVNKLTLENIPKSLDELANLYFTATISEEDRNSFISTYRIPFYRTQKELRQLYEINKDIMKDTLDQLIISKRIQRLINGRETFIFWNLFNWSTTEYLKRNILDFDDRIKIIQQDLSTIIKKYKSKYEEQEGVIAATWVIATEQEPLFRDI